MMNYKVILLKDKDIDIQQLVDELKSSVKNEECGAIVLFIGVVKGLVKGEKVKYLEYEAYEERAIKELERIAREICSRDGVYGVRIYHKISKVKPGENIVYIAVAGRGRDDAFSCAWEIIDRVKHEVPIWKKEVRETGSYWIIGEDKRIEAKF